MATPIIGTQPHTITTSPRMPLEQTLHSVTRGSRDLDLNGIPQIKGPPNMELIGQPTPPMQQPGSLSGNKSNLWNNPMSGNYRSQI